MWLLKQALQYRRLNVDAGILTLHRMTILLLNLADNLAD